MTDVERFWSHVAKSEGCWLWTLRPGQDGYGKFKMNRKTYRAHRVAWTFTHGSIPDGLQVLHSCDVPMCMRPDHLWLGTNDENMADMARKHRAVTGEKNHLSKLTTAQVLEIINSTERQIDLARKYGVVKGTISHIQLGRNWPQLTGLRYRKENTNGS